MGGGDGGGVPLPALGPQINPNDAPNQAAPECEEGFWVLKDGGWIWGGWCTGHHDVIVPPHLAG